MSAPLGDDISDRILRQAVAAARAADDKKASDTIVLDVSRITSMCDAFVIAAGANARQVRTIVEEVEQQLTDEFAIKPRRIEGLQDATWVLIDYGDLVVHVFLEETRRFYDLERLWTDAPRVEWVA